MGSFRHFQVVSATLLTFAAAVPASAAPPPQPLSGFGDAIMFSPSAYTPPGITRLVLSPLASQNRSGFGEAIAFTASAYTPPGITSLVYSSLASQNRSGFGAEIVFSPSAYTPPGIRSIYLIGAAAAE